MFQNKIAKFEKKYTSAIKYKNDFNQENISKNIECEKCKISKPIYLFYNRKNVLSSKDSMCKTCVNQNNYFRKQTLQKIK